MSDIKNCLGCGNNTDFDVSEFCSRPCELAAAEVKNFGATLFNYTSDDQRIFFYDFAFGDLCDLWSTYLLRRVRAKDLSKMRAVDRALERLEKAILTKLNRFVPSPKCQTRKDIEECLHLLLFANARIWEWREKNWNSDEGIGKEEWWDIREVYNLRESQRQQLDAMVDHVTMTEKTYVK
jgi:hypothetical protein